MHVITLHHHYVMYISTQLTPVETVPMEKFVLWEAPIGIRVELRCVSMTNGEQCVMMTGTPLMLLLSVGNWDTLEVSMNICSFCLTGMCKCLLSKQLAGYSATLSLVLGLVLSSWMMSSATQVLVNYWSVSVAQSCHTTAFTLRMLVLGVKVHI